MVALRNMVLDSPQCHPLSMKKNGNERIAWNVRRIRVEKALSQEQLATDSGADRSYVSRLERGLENPTVAMLDRIAKALDVTIADLSAIPTGPKPKPLPSGRRPR